jgi:HEAT repeat protein
MINLRRLQTVLVVCFAFVVPAGAVTLQGIVQDKSTLEPLAGAAVTVVGSSSRAITDSERGHFMLDISEAAPGASVRLRVSKAGYAIYDGYQTATDDNIIFIALTPLSPAAKMKPLGNSMLVADPIITLIDQLRSDDPGTRLNAAEVLGQFGEARAVSPLATALQDSDLKIRTAAARSIGQLAPAGPQAIPALIVCFEDHRDSGLRVLAASALGQYGHAGRAAARYLQLALAEADSDIVAAAAIALLKIGPEPAEGSAIRDALLSHGSARANVVQSLLSFAPEQAFLIELSRTELQALKGNPRNIDHPAPLAAAAALISLAPSNRQEVLTMLTSTFPQCLSQNCTDSAEQIADYLLQLAPEGQEFLFSQISSPGEQPAWLLLKLVNVPVLSSRMVPALNAAFNSYKAFTGSETWQNHYDLAVALIRLGDTRTAPFSALVEQLVNDYVDEHNIQIIISSDPEAAAGYESQILNDEADKSKDNQAVLDLIDKLSDAQKVTFKPLLIKGMSDERCPCDKMQELISALGN